MSNAERQPGLHGLETVAPDAPPDPKMERAQKEFRIAEIRMEIAKLTYEKTQLRSELAAKP